MASRFLSSLGGRGAATSDPFLSLHREMNRLFDTFRGPEGGESGRASFLSPQLDVHESADEFCVTVDLPGVAESDLDVQLDGDLLTIRGEKKQHSERDERGYHVVERSSGTFQRSLRLPFEPDAGKVTADCRDGVLTVHVPKADQKQRSRRISISHGQQTGPAQRTIEGSSAANDGSSHSMQQAASQGATTQAGGADDANRREDRSQQRS